MTVGEQLMEPLLYHKKVSRAQARRRALELLEEVGIREPAATIDNYPHQFSGGMRQRVMIAMALINEPQLLIADEPTTALDVTIQAQILELLASIQKKRDIGIVFISHDLAVVADIADQIVVMQEGRDRRGRQPRRHFPQRPPPLHPKIVAGHSHGRQTGRTARVGTAGRGAESVHLVSRRAQGR